MTTKLPGLTFFQKTSVRRNDDQRSSPPFASIHRSGIKATTREKEI
jgi:hypothetical protein